jgi:hypothetical protein
MAALNFVAADDGLEEDPKLLTLGRILKVPRSTAFWFVMRWQRLILQKGNHLSGTLPKSYTAADIATFLDFTGDPRRLVDAMKRQGYLSFKKGRGFCYPAWRETTSGRYACRREEDRLRKETERRNGRSAVAGPSAGVLGPSSDGRRVGPKTVEGQSTERKQGSTTDLPPDPPPGGGDSFADARWDWLNQHAPTPQNRDSCKRLLATMSPEDWALVQRSFGLLRDPASSISKKNRRVLSWPTDQFLRKQAYLRFGPKERPTRTPPRQPSRPTPVSFEDLEQRLRASDAFYRELLNDPEVPEEKKAEVRSRWLSEPGNANRAPPWVTS